MIGLVLHWSGATLAPSVADRFAASLAEGTVRTPRMLIANNALFVTACASARQPIRMPSGVIVLFNGHIANRATLRRELSTGPTDDDGALYAAARAAWGDAADLRVVGDFCAILCDPSTRYVRITRSPISGPPLNYFYDAECLVVASTPRAIFATGAVAKELDEQKIADSLFLNYAEGERSFFKNVARLPYATRLSFTPDGMARETYHDPEALPAVRFKSDDEYVEAADALLEEGARAALDGCAMPAVSISGGFDSQAVAAYALRVMPCEGRLLGMTSVPEPGWDGLERADRIGDESAHVRAFAAMHPRFDLLTIDAAGLPIDHQLHPLFLMACVPPRNVMNLPWIHALYATAAARGCDVVLTGAMGNMSLSFGGKGAVAAMLGRGQWMKAWREMRASRHVDGSLPRQLLSAVAAWVPRSAMRWVDGQRGQTTATLGSHCPLNRAYAAEMRVVERAADSGLDKASRRLRDTLAPRLNMLGTSSHERGDLEQAMELLYGVPTRDPTAYRPFIEFCLSIPDDQFRRAGVSRWLARRLLRGQVPEMVLDDRRRGLQAADWHLRLGRQRAELIAELDQLAKDPGMAYRFDLASLRAALTAWPAETPLSGRQHDQLRFALSRALATARFIRHVDGGGRWTGSGPIG